MYRKIEERPATPTGRVGSTSSLLRAADSLYTIAPITTPVPPARAHREAHMSNEIGLPVDEKYSPQARVRERRAREEPCGVRRAVPAKSSTSPTPSGRRGEQIRRLDAPVHAGPQGRTCQGRDRVVRRRQAQRLGELPRPAPGDEGRPRGADLGRRPARRQPDHHLPRALRAHLPHGEFLRAKGIGRATASRSTWEWCRTSPSRCSPAPESGRSTR